MSSAYCALCYIMLYILQIVIINVFTLAIFSIAFFSNLKKDSTWYPRLYKPLPIFQLDRTMHILQPNETVHISVVMCGSRFEEGWTSIQSIMFFTAPPLHFHIVLEPDKRKKLSQLVSNMHTHSDPDTSLRFLIKQNILLKGPSDYAGALIMTKVLSLSLKIFA